MEQEIYLTSNGVRTGPYSAPDVARKLSAGQIPPGTLAWHIGLDAWKPVSQVLNAAPPRPTQGASKAGFSWQLITALVLAILATCALSVAGLQVFSHGPKAAWESGAAFAAQFAILLLVGFFAGLGLVVACFHTSPGGRLGWPKIAAIGVNSLCLIISAFLFVSGIVTRARVVFQEAKTKSLPIVGETTMSKQTKEPLDISASSYSEKDDYAHRKAWSERVWLQAYLDNAKRDHRWDEMGTNLIRACITMATSRGDTGRELELLNKDIEILVSNDCQDPLLLMLAARHSHEGFTAYNLLERASNACNQVTYPGAVRLSLFVDLGNSLQDFPNPNRRIGRVDQAALQALNDALTDGSYTMADQDILENVLMDGRGTEFFDRNSTKVYSLLSANPATAPWLTHRIRGHAYVNAAWAARGGGYASTVTEQGWRDFKANLDLAATELTKAWELNPKNPAAAAEMITVAMGNSDDPKAEMRLWLDRAIKARCDYLPAYHKYTWALRPRWFGSHEDMLNFARVCLATRRFDTDVPYRVMHIVLDIDSEQEGDVSDLYARRDVRQMLDEMFAGYLAEPSRSNQRNWFLTMQAATRYSARDWAGCAEVLRKADFKLDKKASEKWPDALDLMPEQVAAMTSPAKASVEEFESAYQDKDIDRARAAMEKAFTQINSDARAADYARHRLVELDMLKRFNAGETVNLMPDASFHGWRVVRSDWSSTGPSALTVKTDHERFSAFPRAGFSSNFDLEFSFAVTDTSNGAFQAGLIFGQLSGKKGDWYSVRFKRNPSEKDAVTFSEGYSFPTVTRPIIFQPENHVRITCSRGRLSVWFNQRLVLENYELPKELNSYDRLQIGLGGYHDSNRTALLFKDLHIRQFKG